MAAPKGIKAVEWLARRAKEKRGGQVALRQEFDRSAPDALALWRDAYLDQLRALWRSTKANGQRLGWSTQRTRLGVLKDFFRWLTKQNVILHNPASELELPRMEKRLPTAALTLTQVETLLAVPNVADPLGVRDRAMLELFYSCGLRRAELCRLELTDLNTERRTLTIRRGKGKKDRVVPVGARAVAWLERYLKEVRPRLSLDTRTPALFLTGYGDAFNPDVVSRMVRAGLNR
jgi:integrase/recombinase XerD